MRFQDLVRFSVDLVLPEKAIHKLERWTEGRSVGGNSPPTEHDPPDHLRRLIEEIDTVRHGGLSFGPETIARMTIALDLAISAIAAPVETAQMRAIAEHILRAAANGERDPGRLQIIALSELQQS